MYIPLSNSLWIYFLILRVVYVSKGERTPETNNSCDASSFVAFVIEDETQPCGMI